MLSVDLRLRDRDEFDQLHSTANRVESIDIGSSDNYCDEVNRIIVLYCRAFHLCKPLFGCSYGCNRRLIFDSSQNTNNLGQLKFKDSQMNGKLDVVLLLFTDQLVICKQISNRWYASSSTQNAQERSPIHNLKSSVYNKSFRSSRHRNSTKSHASQAGWIKSRSASGNHLVDSLALANDRTQPADRRTHKKCDRLLSAHNSTGSDQSPVSLHLSTSSLAGNAAREHFIASKSAEGSRSGESFNQSPTKPPAASSRLRAIRSPYPIDRLVMHELSDGHRIFCCQLNDSNTIATAFILHIGSFANSERGQSKGDHHNQQQREQSTAMDFGRFETQTTMHHLSPLSGYSKRPGKQSQISPARRLINLIELAQAQYKAAARFHGISPTSIEMLAKNKETTLETTDDISSVRRQRLDSSPTRATSLISRSSELLELSHLLPQPAHNERLNVGTGENLLDSVNCVLQEGNNTKAVLDQEQSMLLKHGKYDELQACKLDYGLANRPHSPSHLDPSATGSFVSPLLSVSIDDSRILRVPSAISQNSVFEVEHNEQDKELGDNVDQQSASQIIGHQTGLICNDRTKVAPLSGDSPVAKLLSIETPPVERAFDRRRGQSWSCCNANRGPLVSISGSDVESTASDLSPSMVVCQEPSRVGQQESPKRINHRRQINHLRRQNDIVSFSHDQQENCSGSSLLFSGPACREPSFSVEETEPQQFASTLYGDTNTNNSSESHPMSESSLGQQRRYLSLARRFMHEQNSSSQATTMDQASMTLTDNQLDSMESNGTRAHSRAVSIELGNLKARMSYCATSQSIPTGQEATRSVGLGPRQLSRETNDRLHTTTNERSHDSKSMDDSFDRRQIFLKIPAYVQQVNDESHSILERNSVSHPSEFNRDQGEIISEDYTYSCTKRTRNPLQSGQAEQVTLPVLNVTSADSHSPKQDFSGIASDFDNHMSDSSIHPEVDLGVGVAEKIAVHHEHPEENLQPPACARRPRVNQQTAHGAPSKDGTANQFRKVGRFQPADWNPRSSANFLDGGCSDHRSYRGEKQHSRHFRAKSGENGSFDGDWTGPNYGNRALELKCIENSIHQNKSLDGTCGKVYLGFYEKLDLHFMQNSDAVLNTSCQKPTMHKTGRDNRHIDQLIMKQCDKIVSGRNSPAKSDSSTSRKVKSLRMFTNDIIGSLLRATSSCSIHSKN